jgi:hypothetical protein
MHERMCAASIIMHPCIARSRAAPAACCCGGSICWLRDALRYALRAAAAAAQTTQQQQQQAPGALQLQLEPID